MAWTIINNSKTSITEYLTGSYSTSLSTIQDALLTSITQQTVGATPGDYGPPIASTSSGTGVGATFFVRIGLDGTCTILNVSAGGSGYSIGDTVTIANGLIGGGGTDLIITLAADDFGTDGSGGIQVPDNTSLNSVEQNIAGYPMGVISFTIDPAADGTSLSKVPGALFLSITQPTLGATPGTYSGVSQSSTSGLGGGAIFTITIGGGGTPTGVDVTSGGSEYVAADTITIANSDIGGGVLDLIITLNAGDFATPWAAGSTLEISIIGGIEISNFTMNTLVITEGDTESVQYVDWNIPLQTAALEINNNTTTSTGQEIAISSIRMQTSSKGGGRGFVTSSGASIGPGGDPPQIQFNDGGYFGGTFGALYNKTANTSTGQIQLANGSVGFPILAFPDNSGTYDTGIYLATANAIAISGGGAGIVGIFGSNFGVNFIKGLNVGQSNDICGIRRLSATAANSWGDGHMGNSQELVFTGSDFTNVNNTRFPQGFGVAVPQAGGATGFMMAAAAGPRNNQIIAVKLLPKGFSVAQKPVRVYTSSSLGTVWGNTATIELLTQDIIAPTAPPLSLGAATTMATWASGINEDYLSGPSPVGTGLLALVVRIVILNGQQITANDVLVGVNVVIERQ
ncbi:hypothetical protein OAK19_03100 [Aureispira]|nr:hypothetical protein [Aureispira sp.]